MTKLNRGRSERHICDCGDCADGVEDRCKYEAEAKRLREALIDTVDALERTNRDPAFDYEHKKLAEESARKALER